MCFNLNCCSLFFLPFHFMLYIFCSISMYSLLAAFRQFLVQRFCEWCAHICGVYIHGTYLSIYRVENDKCTPNFYFHRFIFYEKQFVISSMMKPLTCLRPDSRTYTHIERETEPQLTRSSQFITVYYRHIHTCMHHQDPILLFFFLLSLIHLFSRSLIRFVIHSLLYCGVLQF